MKKFSKYFEHTLLKADAKPEDILKLVMEAVRYDFAAVCVNGSHVRSVRRFIDASDADISVAAVVGFPLGAMATNAKAYEAQLALEDGAGEIDLVMNIGQAKAGNWAYVEDEIAAIGAMCHEDGALIKVIIECCLLTDEEIVQACISAERAGADFVKTSTGFSSAGAKAEDVRLMRETVGDRLGVKASGGIRTLEDAETMIDAGADRIGCSATVLIMNEKLNEEA